MSGIPPRMNNQGYRTDYHSIPMGMQTPDMQMAQQLMKGPNEEDFSGPYQQMQSMNMPVPPNAVPFENVMLNQASRYMNQMPQQAHDAWKARQTAQMNIPPNYEGIPLDQLQQQQLKDEAMSFNSQYPTSYLPPQSTSPPPQSIDLQKVAYLNYLQSRGAFNGNMPHTNSSGVDPRVLAAMRMRNVSNPYLSSLARYKNTTAPNFWREFRERLYSNPRATSKDEMENAFEKEKDVFEREMLNEFMKARHMPKQAIQQQLLQKQSIYNRQGYPDEFQYNEFHRVQQLQEEEIQELQRQFGIDPNEKMDESQQPQQFEPGHEFQDPAHIQYLKMQYQHMEQLKLQQQQEMQRHMMETETVLPAPPPPVVTTPPPPVVAVPPPAEKVTSPIETARPTTPRPTTPRPTTPRPTTPKPPTPEIPKEEPKPDPPAFLDPPPKKEASKPPAVSPAQVTVITPKVTPPPPKTTPVMSVAPTGNPLVPHTSIPIVPANRTAPSPPVTVTATVTPTLVVPPPSTTIVPPPVATRVVNPVVPAQNPAAQPISPVKPGEEKEPSMEDLDSVILVMKLPDFKKKIKPLGLQITGNKPDLTKAFKGYIKKGGKPITYWISYLQSTGEDSEQNLVEALYKLKVGDLREKLKELGLQGTGSRQKLVDTAVAHIKKSGKTFEEWMQVLNSPANEISSALGQILNEKMTVIEVKKKMKDLGIPQLGNKQKLVNSLVEYAEKNPSLSNGQPDFWEKYFLASATGKTIKDDIRSIVLDLVEKVSQKAPQLPTPSQEPEKKEHKKRGPKPKKKTDENEPKKKRGRKPKISEEAPAVVPSPVVEPVVAVPTTPVDSEELVKAKSRFSETISDMSEDEIKQLSLFISNTLQGESFKDIFEKVKDRTRPDLGGKKLAPCPLKCRYNNGVLAMFPTIFTLERHIRGTQLHKRRAQELEEQKKQGIEIDADYEELERVLKEADSRKRKDTPSKKRKTKEEEEEEEDSESDEDGEFRM